MENVSAKLALIYVAATADKDCTPESIAAAYERALSKIVEERQRILSASSR